ncbi:PilX N-terminal domain-containing pilus assembly protein [Neptuniibacter sp. QD48_11]|uniref:pilus assembly PilX family protein n=1 Tax=unclassified Neptuniibacter TaxID=2630693 RepID=UPI0039F4B895
MQIKINNHIDNRIGRQKGAATLVLALVMVVIVLGVSFFTSETVITEKKIVANEYRAKQAFHAAQAGIDYAIAYSRVGVDQDNNSVLDLSVSGATVSWGDGVGFTVLLSDASSDADMSLIQIDSVGRSDDGLINRSISVLIGELPLLPNPPDLPIVARGYVNVSGNMNVFNGFTNLNIWAGDDITSWGSADTYIRDPDWTGFSGDTWDGTVDDLSRHLTATGNDIDDIEYIQSTTKNTTGPDVIDGDTNMANVTADEFTQNFFGRTLDELVASASLSMTGNELRDADASDIEGQLIHLNDARLTGGTIGSSANPVILVVDGDLRMSGGPDVYGLIIARNVDRVNGTVDIFGGIVSEGELDMGNGTANVYYDQEVVDNLDQINTKEVIRGSWKDW